jgi:chemotaxis protein methyltransferase CheR
MSSTSLTEEEFDRFITLIYKTSGIRIPSTKRILVSNRIRRRLVATGIEAYAKYYSFLTSAAGLREMPLFLDEITTNETYFYRDVHQYDWFSDKFLPEIIQQARLGKRPKRLRIWSAAASNGSELYSLAIRLLEKKSLLTGWTFTLIGTDLSGAILDSARRGNYDTRTLRLVDPDLKTKYFDETAEPGEWAIKPEVRSLVHWKSHNLLRPTPEEPFDCVFLKNVLIYFDASSKAIVAGHITKALVPGGYLVLGPTEVMSSLLGDLTKRQTWLYQKMC